MYGWWYWQFSAYLIWLAIYRVLMVWKKLKQPHFTHTWSPSLDLAQGWGAGLYDMAVPEVARFGKFLEFSILPNPCFSAGSRCSQGSGTLLGGGEFQNEYAVGWEVINHLQQKQRVNQAIPKAIWRQPVHHQPTSYSPGANRAVYLLSHYSLQQVNPAFK